MSRCSRAATTEILSLRAMNRATLARQLLLERSTLSVEAVLEHLVGMQAQTPHTAYVGLWGRLVGFRTRAARPIGWSIGRSSGWP